MPTRSVLSSYVKDSLWMLNPVRQCLLTDKSKTLIIIATFIWHLLWPDIILSISQILFNFCSLQSYEVDTIIMITILQKRKKGHRELPFVAVRGGAGICTQTVGLQESTPLTTTLNCLSYVARSL